MKTSRENPAGAIPPASVVSSITASDARARAASALLLDVRTPGEYAEEHIEGSVSHPLSGLDADAVARLAEGKSACVVICQVGGRAAKAAEKLAANGLVSLSVLEGGVDAWKKAGLPLVLGVGKTISLERQVRIAAGSLVAIGVALGYFVHPAWLILPAFVGCGLVFAGISNFCGMGLLLARMPWNRR